MTARHHAAAAIWAWVERERPHMDEQRYLRIVAKLIALDSELVQLDASAPGTGASRGGVVGG